ncbi:MAG TPA: dephospho-CoA kinase [Candidatus Binatia bacterium]|nr:dephospho-CoA kinase [Candidatus Binatia bacterium]
MHTIGLTGGIGSGKSTVAKLLADLGAHVIHADLVGHQVYRPGTEGWECVVQAFGRDIVATDGTIDRRRLGALVFADSKALKRLNAIVHPLIYRAIEREIAERRNSNRPQAIVVEAAILIEANWLPLIDELWLVVADRDAVIARVVNERGLARGQIEARIAAQLSDDERRKFAQLVIENSGSLRELEEQVRAAWARVTP